MGEPPKRTLPTCDAALFWLAIPLGSTGRWQHGEPVAAAWANAGCDPTSMQAEQIGGNSDAVKLCKGYGAGARVGCVEGTAGLQGLWEAGLPVTESVP